MGWWMIIVGSSLFGLVCALLFPRSGGVLAGGVPLVAVSSYILYGEYFVPYQGGGASMFPIAIIFAGGGAAAFGVTSFVLCSEIIKKMRGET